MHPVPLPVRRALGIASSFLLHAATILLAVWTAPRVAPIVRMAAAEPVVVLVGPDAVPRVEPDDLGIHVESPSIALPGFAFDERKVMARAGALFPFLTGRPSLERAAGEPRRTALGLSWNGGQAPPTVIAKSPLTREPSRVRRDRPAPALLRASPREARSFAAGRASCLLR